MSEHIEIWERIWFSGGEAVRWQRSLDKGQTWEDVNYPGKPPFVMLNAANVDYVIKKSWLPATKQQPHST